MITSPLSSDPWRERLIEIEGHLHRFDQEVATSQEKYDQSQAFQSDAALKSALLEAHMIHLSRQLHAIKRMQALHQKVLDRLTAIESGYILLP